MGPIRTTRAQALLSLAIALIWVLASPSMALADGRANPAARSYPRSFDGYDRLVGFAAQVAKDQRALDTELATVHADGLALAAQIPDDEPFVGGILWSRDEVKAERAAKAALRGHLAQLATRERELVAAGARLDPATGPWSAPVQGEVTQPFGPTDLWLEPSATWRGVTYAHFHGGVDIAAPWGSPVVAPAPGRVAFAGYMADGALVVTIAHDDGRVSLFAHLAGGDGWAPPVAAGDRVDAGERIGSIGLTGMSTGPHVHWAVYEHGQVIDPLALTR